MKQFIITLLLLMLQTGCSPQEKNILQPTEENPTVSSDPRRKAEPCILFFRDQYPAPGYLGRAYNLGTPSGWNGWNISWDEVQGAEVYTVVGLHRVWCRSDPSELLQWYYFEITTQDSTELSVCLHGDDYLLIGGTELNPVVHEITYTISAIREGCSFSPRVSPEVTFTWETVSTFGVPPCSELR